MKGVIHIYRAVIKRLQHKGFQKMQTWQSFSTVCNARRVCELNETRNLSKWRFQKSLKMTFKWLLEFKKTTLMPYIYSIKIISKLLSPFPFNESHFSRVGFVEWYKFHFLCWISMYYIYVLYVLYLMYYVHYIF